MKRLIFTLILLLIIIGCRQANEPISPPPEDIPYSDLIAAPETLFVEGNQLVLTSNLWLGGNIWREDG